MDYRAKHQKIYRYSVQINQYFQDVIASEMNRIAQEMKLKGNLRFSHYFILCELYHAEDLLSLTQISQLVGVKLPNISALISELIEIGVVDKGQLSDNKRKVAVYLTKVGREYSERLLPTIIKATRECFGSAEEIEYVYGYYERIYEKLFAKGKD